MNKLDKWKAYGIAADKRAENEAALRAGKLAEKEEMTLEGNVSLFGMNNTIKWHSSYLRKIARELRSQARKEARGRGFEPLFDKGDSFSVEINAEGSPFVQINYTVGGSNQCANCEI